MATSSPTNKLSTHHMVLSRDGSDLGLNLCDAQGNAIRHGFKESLISGVSLQIHEGDAEHSDLELPWKTIQQVDWSGGLGRKYLDDDATAYGYVEGLDTTQPGKILAAPYLRFSTGHRSFDKSWLGSVSRRAAPLNNTIGGYAESFSASITATMNVAVCYLRKVGSPTGNVTIAVYTNSASLPNTVVSSVTYACSSIQKYFAPVYTETLGAALTSGTTYWFVITYSSGTATDYVEVMTHYGTNLGATYTSPSWATGDYAPYFRMYVSQFGNFFHPFVYKGSLYAIKVARDLSASTKLYINGDAGSATGGSASTLTDSTKSWTTNEWAGSVVTFNRGSGSSQVNNYAIISSNTGTQLSFLSVDDAPAAQTEYSIIASDKFTEITGHGLAQKYVTDVLVANGAVYVCQGNDANVRLLHFYVNTGTGAWTREYADEGYKAQFMKPYSNATSSYIAAALPGVPAQVKSAAMVDHSANASSTTALGIAAASAETVGDLYEKITGLEVYQYGRLHALKEHSIHAKDENGDWYQIDVREYENLQDPRNGVAHLVNGVYLWFSALTGVSRYSFENSVIDEMGYDQSELGFEKYGGGSYRHLSQYRGKIFGCVETGLWNKAHLMVHNLTGREGVGWCNWHSSIAYSNYSEKINKSFVQSIPGVLPDRVWFDFGGDICWVPITQDNWGSQWIDTLQDYLEFHPIGTLETSWIVAKFHDINKLWKSISFEVEHYDPTNAAFEYMVEYDIDDGNGWQTLATKITATGTTTLTLSSTYSVVSKKIRFRIHLFNKDFKYTPAIVVMTVKSLLRVPVEWQAAMFVRIADDDTDLLGEKDPQDADEKLALMDTFMSTPEPVLVTSISRLLHNDYWVVEPSEVNPYKNEPIPDTSGEENRESHAYAIRMYKVS